MAEDEHVVGGKSGDGLEESGWRVIGASVQGSSHLKSGQPCQDAHQWVITPDGVLLIAVADGAGSAEFGALGAQSAASFAVGFLTSALVNFVSSDESAWQRLLTSTVAATRGEIERIAQERNHSFRELASTLILVTATDDALTALQIGDGAIVIREAGDGELTMLTRPQNGEYINETTFLISADYLENAQIVFRRGRVAGLALLTDGLQMLALTLPGCEPHAPFFEPLFRFAESAGNDAGEQLTAFLRSPRIAERADDDLTLVMAVR
jgi:hypothetical protein